MDSYLNKTNPIEYVAALNAVQIIYGPPADYINLSDAVASKFEHDFNGDDKKELVLLFSDDGLSDIQVKSVNDLNGVITCGFIMLTNINDHLWPVFYYYDSYRTSLSYKTVFGVTGLVSEGGRGHTQYVWGWQKENENIPARWSAFYRSWDSETKSYGFQNILPQYISNYGK
jgi:hypothetical protein